MKRIVTGVGIAVIALATGVAASQVQVGSGAQGRGPRPEVQRDQDEFHCGPARGPEDGKVQQPPRGNMQGRGPGMGRMGAAGRPGGRGPGGGRGGGFGGPDRALCALGLTEDQQAQISAIQKKTREDIEAVLTPEQREKLRAMRDGGRGNRPSTR